MRVTTTGVALLLSACLGCSQTGARSLDDDGGAGEDAALDVSPRDSSGDTAADGPAADAGDARADAPGDSGDASFHEAPRAPFPQIPDGGGPTLAAPQLVTITFSGYAYTSTVSAFGDWIVGSHWLSVVGADYGVGKGTHVPHVVLPASLAAATMTDLDTQKLLEDALTAGTLPSAEGADAGTPADAGAGGYLYMVFYPPGTDALGFLAGPTTCAYLGGGSFIGGYHWETQSGPYHVPYAVVPTCTGSGLTENVTDVETSASHEFIEAATDPLPYTQPAWGLNDPANPWTYLDGEVADLCEGETTTESTFSAQRVWSNTAAKGNGSPCVPAPAGTFFGTSPSPDTVQSVAAGKSATFTLTGFSTAPMAPWSIAALPAYTSFTPTVTLSASTIDNGGTATLTVGVPAGTPSMGFASILVSSYTSPTDLSYWPVVVTVP